MKFYVLCGILTLKGINHRAMKVWLPYVLSVIFSVNICPDSQLFFNFKGNKMQLTLISSTWGTYILLSGVKNAKDLFFKHFTKLLSFGLTLTSSFLPTYQWTLWSWFSNPSRWSLKTNTFIIQNEHMSKVRTWKGNFKLYKIGHRHEYY